MLSDSWADLAVDDRQYVARTTATAVYEYTTGDTVTLIGSLDVWRPGSTSHRPETQGPPLRGGANPF